VSAAGAGSTAGRAGLTRHVGVWAAVVALGVGGTAFAGCGGDDDDQTAATTPDTTTTEAEAKEPKPPPGSEDTGSEQPSSDYGGNEGVAGEGDPTPADTGSPVPESGGVGVDDTSEPEEDTEKHDVPPPPGSPAEAFEQACDADPELCE
jgi:hypothetical protein